MRFIIQRVSSAEVSVKGDVVGKIDDGYMVLIGINHTDTEQIADKMVKKLLGLRIFEDNAGKANLDIKTVSGSLLLVSQFTLYADCKKGNRPSFIQAAEPQKAEQLYRHIITACKKEIPIVRQGVFGADMKVSLINDGPFTIILDSNDI